MKVKSQHAELLGSIDIPGSKTHTYRACFFAAFAEGVSHIQNPLRSGDCLSAAAAIQSFGAKAVLHGDEWAITGAGRFAHLPEDVVHVGSSGCALYMLAPLAATFSGWTVFTGNETLRAKPVAHMLDMLSQLGCQAEKASPARDGAPVMVRGAMHGGSIVTSGHFSPPITGLLMAAARCAGKTEIMLTDPKETPYLKMTKQWFDSLGLKINMSDDCKHISLNGSQHFPAFSRKIPSDWESVAFPLVAGVITDSDFVINNIDTSGSQGDAVIADILRDMGADIRLVESDARERTGYIEVRGGRHAKNGGKLRGTRVNCASYPDILPALAVAACFAEGETVIEGIEVCRKKAVDRAEVMAKELAELGVDVQETENALTIRGKAPSSADFLHGGALESYGDHRIAMALCVLGLGLPDGSLTINAAECCDFSFPGFYTRMNGLGANLCEIL